MGAAFSLPSASPAQLSRLFGLGSQMGHHPTLPEPGWLVWARCGTRAEPGCAVGPGVLGAMAAWPVLPSPEAGLRTGPECRREMGYLSAGVLLDPRLQLQPGCFAMSSEKALIPGRTEEWNAPCQQGCG